MISIRQKKAFAAHLAELKDSAAQIQTEVEELCEQINELDVTSTTITAVTEFDRAARRVCSEMEYWAEHPDDLLDDDDIGEADHSPQEKI